MISISKRIRRVAGSIPCLGHGILRGTRNSVAEIQQKYHNFAVDILLKKGYEQIDQLRGGYLSYEGFCNYDVDRLGEDFPEFMFKGVGGKMLTHQGTAGIKTLLAKIPGENHTQMAGTNMGTFPLFIPFRGKISERLGETLRSKGRALIDYISIDMERIKNRYDSYGGEPPMCPPSEEHIRRFELSRGLMGTRYLGG